MNLQFFTDQMTRIKSEWANSFGPERQAALWDIFKSLDDEVFRTAVTRLILNGTTYPPRLKDFEREVELARSEWKSRKWDEHNHTAPDTYTPASPDNPRVKDYIHRITQAIGSPRPESSGEARKELLREQLKVISGRDKAAGVERDEE